MNERNTPSYSNKVVDLKPRGEGRIAHSQFGHFVPDEELLQSTARIKSQRDLIHERLQKMNTSQTRVSKGVYDKVRRDYTLQLETINELLLEKKQLLKEEIKKLYINREKLSFEINRHREILEEAEFRHFLAEFTQSQYQEVENFETKEIEKLEADLTHISQWIRTHEDLFDPEDFGHKRPETTNKSQEAVTKTVARPEPQSEVVPQKASEPAPSETATAHAEKAIETFDQEPVTTAPSDNVEKSDTGDFSHLFSDDKTTREGEDLFGSTEDNINALLESSESSSSQEEETTPLKARIDNTTHDTSAEADKLDDVSEPESQEKSAEEDDLLPEPLEEDYFKQDKVNESSFSIQKQEEESVTASRGQPISQPAQPHTVSAPQAKTVGEVSRAGITDRQVTTPDVVKPVSRDDSISNILDSIRLDDDDAAAPTSTEIAAASTAIQTEFKLILLQGDLDDRVFAVKDNTAIGRSPSNDVILKEPKVSRQHAAINKYNEHYILIDLKSSNGVYVNGAKVDECVLHPGDEISIGGYKFSFQKT